jgi:hypothetical protein
LEDVQKAALDLAQFGRYVKLKSFAPFKSAGHALANIMDVTEGQCSDFVMGRGTLVQSHFFFFFFFFW